MADGTTSQDIVARILPYLQRSYSVEDARKLAAIDGYPLPKASTLRHHFRSTNSGSMSDYLMRHGSGPEPAYERQDSTDDAVLLAAVKRCDGTLEGLCDALDMAPSKVRQLVDEAQERGLAVDADGDLVSMRQPRPRERIQPIAFDEITHRVKFAAITDTHAGSKYARADALGDFVAMAYEQGVRHVVHCGDILDGSPHMHRGMLYEQDDHGLLEQCEAALDAMPQLPGLKYYCITGNHDVSFYKTDGADPGRTLILLALERGRDDVHYLGQDKARCFIGGDGEDGLAVDLLHPGGGGASKNMSLKLRNIIDGYASGNKPQLMLMGHHHQYCAINFRRIAAFALPAFQDQTPFMRSKGIHPTVGGTIFDVECADDWSIRSLSHTVIEYPGRGYDV